MHQVELFESLDLFFDNLTALALLGQLPLSKVVFPGKVVPILRLIADNSGNDITIWITDVVVAKVELLDAGVHFHSVWDSRQCMPVYVDHVQRENLQDFRNFQSLSQYVPACLTYFDADESETPEFSIMVWSLVQARLHVLRNAIDNVVRVINVFADFWELGYIALFRPAVLVHTQVRLFNLFRNNFVWEQLDGLDYEYLVHDDASDFGILLAASQSVDVEADVAGFGEFDELT